MDIFLGIFMGMFLKMPWLCFFLIYPVELPCILRRCLKEMIAVMMARIIYHLDSPCH